MRILRPLLTTLSLILPLILCGKDVRAQRNSTVLPSGVRAYLNKSYSGWRLITVATGCYAEYKRAVVTGDFDGDGRLDHAVKFLKGSKGYFIAFLGRNTNYEPHILLTTSASELKNTGMTVARRGEKYPIGDLEENRYGRLPNDAPVIGVCESEACPFIYRNGVFRCG